MLTDVSIKLLKSYVLIRVKSIRTKHLAVRVGLNLNFEFAPELLMKLNLTFASSMNLILVFAKSINLNLFFQSHRI